MKARFVTKAALSALTLAFAGTLPGVAQQTAAPAVDSVKASAVEKVFIVKMGSSIHVHKHFYMQLNVANKNGLQTN